MRCLADFCVFNWDYRCTRHEISIGELGVCKEYIPISLDKEFIKNEKRRLYPGIKPKPYS